MEIKLCKTPGEFLEDHAAFLAAREPQCQLNYGNAAAHGEEPCSPSLLFGRVEQAGRPVLLFGNTLPWNLCLNAVPDDPAGKEAAQTLAAFLRAQGVPVHGVTGQEALCRAFLSVWGGSPVLRSAMEILVLRQLTPPPGAVGAARPATPEDLPVILSWCDLFQREIFHQRPNLEELRRARLADVEAGRFFLWDTGRDSVVSMAALTRALPHGTAVSWVYTPTAQRGKGWCQNLVSALCARRLAGGDEYLTLYVDRANPVSNRVYEKLGFRPVEDCCDYRLEED